MKPMQTVTDSLVNKTLELGKLILRFAKIKRNTTHEDGITPETDTDHTVMLGIIACAFAEAYKPHLDTGKIAQFALVHDLIEAYAGDTVTISITKENLKKKDEREKIALQKIKENFEAVYPWIHNTIEEYESYQSEEARFVKALDKAMPALTYALNNAAALKKLNLTKTDIEASVRETTDRMLAAYGHDQPEAIELLHAFVAKYLNTY